MVKIIKLPFLMLVISITLAYAINCPTPDQVKICNDDETNCRCVPCPVCKPGEGLNYECLGTLSDRVTLKCIPCKPGETYSSGNHTGTCQPCPRCEGHLTESPCTTTSPTKCSPDKCRDGYTWNSMVEDCEHIPMPPSTTAPLTTVSTTILPSTAVSTSPQTTKPTPSAKTPTTQEAPTMKTEPGTDDHYDDIPRQESSSDDHKVHLTEIKTWVIITLVIVVVIVLAIIATAIYMGKDRRNQCKRCCVTVEEGQPEEQIPLGDVEGSPSTDHKDNESQKVGVYPWPKGCLLKDISYKIKNIIAIKTSNPEEQVWEQIGEELNIEPLILSAISNFSSEKRGKQFLEVLKTYIPNLTLTELMNVCAKLKRYDIVEDVKAKYQEIEPFHASQVIEVEQELPQKE